jgi:hypothetical protein
MMYPVEVLKSISTREERVVVVDDGIPMPLGN